MTKERRLAIEMWTDIRNMIATSYRIASTPIAHYKIEFCVNHDLHWMNYCWFCKYIHDCKKCPLKSCMCLGSLYDTVCSENKEKDLRIDACNNIIKALGGEA